MPQDPHQPQEDNKDLEDALDVDTDDDSNNLVSQHSPAVDYKLESMMRTEDDGDVMLSEDLDGEESVSGESSDPESDDNTLEMSHQVGLRLDEDEENPRELNIAADVAAAERSRRGLNSDVEDDEDDV